MIAAVLDRLSALSHSGLHSSHLGSVLRGASMVMGVRIAGAGVAFLSQVLLARWMGAFEFGIFAYASVWIIVLGIFAPLGFNTSVLRFIPDYRVRKRWGRVRGVINASRLIAFISSVIMSAAALGLLHMLSGTIEPYYRLPLMVAVATVPVFALLDMNEGVSRAFGWMSLAYVPVYILRPGLVAVAVGAFVWITGEADALSALVLAAALLILIVAGQSLVLRGRLKAALPEARPRWHARTWIWLSVPLVIIEGVYLILNFTDILMLGAYLVPDDVAVYFAATKIVGLIAMVHFAVAAGAVPKFSELHASGDRESLQRFVTGASHAVFWPSLLGGAAVLLAGPFLLHLFGPEFIRGYEVLPILVIGLVARAAFGPIEFLLNMAGRQKESVVAHLVAAVLNVVLNAALIPSYGLAGAAVATSLVYFGVTLWLFTAVRRYLGIVSVVSFDRATRQAASELLRGRQ